MFERYTEKARRVVFFARYEASQHGVAWIDTPCLLLGILREGKDVMARLLPAGSEEIASLSADVDALFPETTQEIATSVDLPLNHAAKNALAFAAEESERLEHKFIDPRHLLLGLLREGGAETACLKAHGIDLAKVQAEILRNPPMHEPDSQHALDRGLAWARLGDLAVALQKVPADRRRAALTLLEGLASGKFEATGTTRNGPFHFSFDDKTE